MPRYYHHYKAFDRAVLCGIMFEPIAVRAKAIKAAAIALAPVGSEADGDPHPGHYKASFFDEVEIKDTGHGRFRGPRAVGIIGNTADYAGAVEFGTRGRGDAGGGRVAHAPLRKAMYGGGAV